MRRSAFPVVFFLLSPSSSQLFCYFCPALPTYSPITPQDALVGSACICFQRGTLASSQAGRQQRARSPSIVSCKCGAVSNHPSSSLMYLIVSCLLSLPYSFSAYNTHPKTQPSVLVGKRREPAHAHPKHTHTHTHTHPTTPSHTLKQNKDNISPLPFPFLKKREKEEGGGRGGRKRAHIQ